MKVGKSITELAIEIERQANAKKDFIADTRALSLNALGELELKNGETRTLPVNRHALRQIAERVGLPMKYADRMALDAPELLATNVNHWFAQKPERRMVRTLDGVARAFLSDRYQRIDHVDVAEAIFPIVHRIPGIEILSSEITESKLYVKAVTHSVRAEIKSKRVGDFVEAGFVFSNSETGLGSFSVFPFVNFLICTNGMVRNKDGMRAFHVGRQQASVEFETKVLSDKTKRLEDAAVLSRAQDVIKAAIDQTNFEKWVDSIQQTVEQKIEGDPVQAVEVLGETFSFNQSERTGVLRHLIQGGDLSRYGLMNAVTRTAEDLESYDRATEFETFGGAVVDLPKSEWHRIAIAA
jgi:hypothetical protein